MIKIYLLSNLAILCMIYFMAGYGSNNRDRGIFNISVFYVVIMLFVIIDFWVFNEKPIIDIYETIVLVNQDLISESLSYIFLFNFCFLLAQIALQILSPKQVVKIPSFDLRLNSHAVELVFYFVLILIMLSLLVNFSLIVGVFKGYYTRQVLLGDNKILYILYSLLVPLYFFYYLYSNSNRYLKLFVLCLVLLISLSSGSRGVIILIIMFHLMLITKRLNMKITIWHVLFGIPFLGYFLIYTRYIFREQWRFASLSDFINHNGGVLNVFFNTAEVSMAEVLTTIITLEDKFLRFPFESFLAGIMFPFPRSIFDFKPSGASAEFTEKLSPLRWVNSKSEIVTTGFGDLVMQFGKFVSLPVFFGFVYFILRFYDVIRQRNTSLALFLNIYLIWFLYVFIRADVYNMFSHIWSVLLSVIMLVIASKIIRFRI